MTPLKLAQLSIKKSLFKQDFSIFITILAIICVSSISIISYTIVRELILNRLENEQVLQVEDASDKIDGWLASKKSQIETIAAQEILRDIDWEDEDVQLYLKLEQRRLKEYWNMIIVNKAGDYYGTKIGFAKGKNLRDRHYFKIAMTGMPNISDLVISRSTGVRQINVAAPIWTIPPWNQRSKKKHLKPPVGALLGVISIKHIEDVVSQIVSTQDSYAFALDSAGVPLAYSKLYQLTEKSLLNDPDPTRARLAQSMVNHEKGIQLIQLGGKWVYVAYVPLDEAPWSLALVIPKDILEANLQSLNTLASVLGVILVIAVISVLRQIQLFNQTRVQAAKEAEQAQELAEANAEILNLNDRLKADNIRMGAELDVTRKLQQMLLPKEYELGAIAGLEIAGFMEPAAEVGGDYYDVLKHNGRVKIGIGDVTGHGLESGVLMIMVQTAVRTLLASNETDPVKFLDVVNQTIYENVQRMNSDKNMTLCLLDYQEGTLRLSGQHEEMIVVRTDGSVERIDTVDLGFPIGLDAHIAEFVSETEVKLNSGDLVVLYTDGITEAENLERVLYGLSSLIEVVKTHRHQEPTAINDAVIQDVRRHIGEQKVFDDITLLVLKQK